MSGADRLEIVVVGSSVAAMVSPARTGRSEGTFGELLPGLLAAAGIDARVQVHAHWFGTINELLRGYEHEVRDHFPDVLVVNYGAIECQPHVLPTWLARHATTWDIGSSRWSVRYRRRVVPPLWRVLRRWQQVGSRVVGQRTARLSSRRFAWCIRRLVDMSRAEVHPLVLVLDIDPAGPRFRYWLPGLDARVARWNAALADTVEAVADPEVRLVRTSEVVEVLGADAALPDGMHRSASGHAWVAARIADEVIAWRKAADAA